MEEDKIQSLHDSLSKLRKSAGLGISSHLNFGGPNKSSHTKRDDGLPSNELYSNFVREGLYDHTKKDQNDAAKYGDGRFIKRNFDDCTPVAGQADDVSSDDCDDSSAAKLQRKAKKKKNKKAAKLEAKRQAKLEEKKKEKLAAKRLLKISTARKEQDCKSDPIGSEVIQSKTKKSKKSKRRNREDDSRNKLNDDIINIVEQKTEVMTTAGKESERTTSKESKSKKPKITEPEKLIGSIGEPGKKIKKKLKKARKEIDSSKCETSTKDEKNKKKKKEKKKKKRKHIGYSEEGEETISVSNRVKKRIKL